MINSLLPVIGTAVAVFILVKFFGSIVKGILTLALIAAVFMICFNNANGTPLLNAITPKTQAQVQQTASQEVSTIVQKLKGLNNKNQMKTFLQNSRVDLVKYELAIKQAFATPNQVQ